MPLSIILCTIAGVVGAYFSLKSTQGWNALWPFFAGQLAIGVWAWMTKQPMTPWVAAVLFDGVYGLSWLITLLALGERPGLYQWVGAGLVMLGLFLAGVEG